MAREGDCAAAAWVIGLWGEGDNGQVYEPLMLQGTFLQVPCSAFLAEAIALETAFDFIDNLL